jgi:hypothetical protein
MTSFSIVVADPSWGQRLLGYPGDIVFSTETVTMTDASERDKAGQGAEDPVVRSVIEQLDARIVSSGDRVRLRGSLDKAGALRIPDNLSEESFRYLLRWITTVVSHAESRRGLTTKIYE